MNIGNKHIISRRISSCMLQKTSTQKNKLSCIKMTHQYIKQKNRTSRVLSALPARLFHRITAYCPLTQPTWLFVTATIKSFSTVATYVNAEPFSNIHAPFSVHLSFCTTPFTFFERKPKRSLLLYIGHLFRILSGFWI